MARRHPVGRERAVEGLLLFTPLKALPPLDDLGNELGPRLLPSQFVHPFLEQPRLALLPFFLGLGLGLLSLRDLPGLLVEQLPQIVHLSRDAGPFVEVDQSLDLLDAELLSLGGSVEDVVESLFVLWF